MINKDNLGVSLYRQIVDGLISSIQDGQLATGDPIPSLNALKDRHQVSRDTVLMAYNELKTRGIIDSKPGKGYYVSSTNIEVQKKVFLLLDENSSYKSTLYKSFLGHCEGKAQVEVFFHHHRHLLPLLEDNAFALAAGDSDVGILSLTGAVDHAAHHRHLYRFVNFRQPFLNCLG